MAHLGCDEVAGTLLDGELALEGVRHLAAVPFESFAVVVIAIEEVHLTGGFLNLRMKKEHLEEGPGAAFPHADDYRLGQMTIRLREVDLAGEEERRCRPDARYELFHRASLDTGSRVQTVDRAVVQDVKGKEQRDQSDREKSRGHLRPWNTDDQNAVRGVANIGRPHGGAGHPPGV